MIIKSLRVGTSVNYILCSYTGCLNNEPYALIEWATSKTVNIGGDRMNPGIKILPLSSANGLF